MQYLPSRQAAKILGLHPHTLRRYADQGIIPSIRAQSGQRRYDVQTYLGNSKPMTTICYCRVSSNKQTGELQRQVAFMQEHYPGAEVITDVASGLNYRRKGLATVVKMVDFSRNDLSQPFLTQPKLCRRRPNSTRQRLARESHPGAPNGSQPRPLSNRGPARTGGGSHLRSPRQRSSARARLN